MAGDAADDWTTKLEDLLDEGDSPGAKKLLESVISHLEERDDAPTSLRLAAALSDLAALYSSEGLTIKADSLSNSTLLIKNRVENLTEAEEQSVAFSSVNSLNVERAPFEVQKSAGEPSTSASGQEEEWESVLCEGLVKLDGLSTVRSAPELVIQEKSVPKQRGRGAFTFGDMGMYSDRVSMFPSSEGSQTEFSSEETENEETLVGAHSKVVFGVRHVLVINFPPKVTAKDLEDLFEPFTVHGVVIRWVNDTTALAVFRNPDIAREALHCTQNPQFKLHELDEDSDLCGLYSEKDLEPPAPRPATSSHAAQRMIMGALRKQGLNKKALSKNSFPNLQKQEGERRQRLLIRQKLKDEAWGPDG